MRGSELVGAVEEERFTRRKHDGGIPLNAFRWCLERAGISVGDLDAVAVGIDPDALASRRGAFNLPEAVAGRPQHEDVLRDALGIEAPIHFVAHHAAHAASAYHYSGFSDAAVLVADGVGDWPCTSLWHGSGERLDVLDAWDFPNSLGLFYAAITSWLGFRVNNDEYKVMGLAAHGTPSLIVELGDVLRAHPSTTYELNLDYFDFLDGTSMYSARMVDLLGPERQPDQPLTEHHRNVAASAQRVLEDRLLSLAGDAHRRTGSPRLCVAGGVGLNAVANARLVAEGPFDDLFFQPAAGDAGTALGAAATVMIELEGTTPAPLTDARLGPEFTTEHAIVLAQDAQIPYEVLGDDDLVASVADLIAAGGVVGWFRGALEFGPRALGARSILADPRFEASRDRINLFIKHREAWRPLAPMVTAELAHVYFDTERSLRFMVETAAVKPGVSLGAVTHIDRTARPQTVDAAAMPTVARLLSEVNARIGVPVLVSTSFNHASEPIVTTPREALLAASRLGLDALVIENCLIADLPVSAFDRIALWQQRGHTPETSENLYPL